MDSSNNGGSLLIPKIDPEKTDVLKVPNANKEEVSSTANSEPVQPKPMTTFKINDFSKGALSTPKKKIKPILWIIPVVLLGIIAIYLICGLLFVSKAKKEYAKLSPIIANQDMGDIAKLKTDFEIIRNSVNEIKSSYKLISWMRITPFVGFYVKDLGHGLNAGVLLLDAGDVTLKTVSPYLSVLGYDNQAQKDGEKTAQERIDFIVGAIPEVIPKVGEISEKVSAARVELDQIDPEKYPENFKGKNVREMLKKGLDMFDQVESYVSQSKPLLEVAPYLLGIDGERKYLVLFQNDKELRATGGFLTAYSIMKVENARFEPVSSADIYHLDAVYKPVLPAPDPIVELIKGPYVLSKNIRIRDINYSPDFEKSMDLFSQEAEKVGIDNVDGIIAVDTGLLVNLLDALGEIGVSGFGNFSTKIEPKCNCPQVIYELESFADTEGPIVWDPVSGKIVYTPPNYDNRKKIIGPLMNSILANAMGQPKEKLPDLFNAVFKSLFEKHVLFYLFDDKAQKAVSDFGIAGKIRDFEGDYLHINDSNLGGRKSNLYVTQEVEQEIEVAKDGTIEKTVTITYKNPEKYDGWLNSVLPNWVRIYVPKGSTLIAAEGLEKKYETVEELGKSVFSGYFKLRPEGVSKVTFKYRLPMKYNGDYKMLIQKQPGTDSPLYIVRTKSTEDEFFLKADKEIRVKI